MMPPRRSGRLAVDVLMPNVRCGERAAPLSPVSKRTRDSLDRRNATMNTIKVWNSPDPKVPGADWIAEMAGQPQVRGRHAEEAVRDLMATLQNKGFRWDPSAE
jgi:hypothetical protein